MLAQLQKDEATAAAKDQGQYQALQAQLNERSRQLTQAKAQIAAAEDKLGERRPE